MFWLWAASALLVLLVMLPARSDADRLEQIGLADCGAPCWEGIIPGQTTTEQAVTRLRERGLIQQRPVIFQRGRTSLIMPLDGEDNQCQAVVTLVGGRVTQAGVIYCFSGPVQVGDVMLAFGLPDTIHISSQYLAVIGTAAIRTLDGWRSPFSTVLEVTIVIPPDDPPGVAWRGFAPLWKLCQHIQRAWYGCVPILRR
jgi:hypothetical protein